MNNEENKKLILDFLNENKGKRYTINSLFEEIKKKYPDMNTSYYPFAILLENLIASKTINSVLIGKIKVIWYGKTQ